MAKPPVCTAPRQCAGLAKRGVSPSAETRAKLSEALRGRRGEKRGPLSREHRAKLSAADKGKPKTPEHAAKVGLANRGKVRSAETRMKISASLKQYYGNLSD